MCVFSEAALMKKARWEAKKEGRYRIVQLSSIKKMEPFLRG